MAYFNFLDNLSLAQDVLQEAYDFSLQFFKLWMGFEMGYAFLNYQSFLDWSLTITAMDFIFTRVISEVLHQLLPQSMHSFLYKDILAEFIALGVICLVLQQSLMLLLLSRLLYAFFCFYSYLFSRLILESLAIAFYLKSAWFLLPVSINILISILYLIDISLSLDVFYFFLELPFIQGILTEFGIRTDMFLNYKIDLGKKGNQYYYLIMQDESFFNQLRSHYLESSSRTQLKIKYNEFKSEISQYYHQKPAVFMDNADKIVSLPLEWSDLALVLEQYPSRLHAEILKPYYKHPYHTVWRMLNSENQWLAKDTDSWKNHKYYHQPHYQEMMVLMWLRAKKNKQEAQFIHDIAKIYRHRNHGVIKFKLFINELDNHQSDMPDSIEHFQNYILHHLEKCTEHDLVTESKIKSLWKEEIKQYWKKYLDSLSMEDFFELRFLWKAVLAGRQAVQQKIFKVMDLDETFYSEFINKMKIRFGEKWKDFHSDYVNELFMLSQGYSCHIEKFTISFSELMKKYFKEELSNRVGLNARATR